MHSIHIWELGIIKALQEYRNGILDTFFIGMNFLDTTPFYFLIIPIIWLGYDWKWGIRLLFLLLVSQTICLQLKDIFMQPRPFDMDPSLGMIHVKGYGLPSGGATVSSCLMGYLALNWKTPLGWVVAGAYVLLICFSRVFLGVHFISDVIAGVLLGSTVAYLGYYAIPRVETWLHKQTWMMIAVVASLAPLILLMPPITIREIQAVTVLIGGCLALIVALKWELVLPPADGWGKGIARAFIAAIGSAPLFWICGSIRDHMDPVAFVMVRGLLAVIWPALLAPSVCRALKLA